MENTHFNYSQQNLLFRKKFISVMCPDSCLAGSIDAAYWNYRRNVLEL